MNHCYFCEELLDLLPKDGKQRICEGCKKSLPKEFWPAQTPASVADFWTRPPAEQRKIQAKTQRKGNV